MSDETTVTVSQLLQPQLIFLPKLIWFNSQFWFSYVFIFLTRLISRDDVVILDSLNCIKGNLKYFSLDETRRNILNSGMIKLLIT